jgi:hypothetical protein
LFDGSSVAEVKISRLRVWARRLTLAIFGLVVASVLLVWWLSSKSLSEQCEELGTVTLSTEQLISMKRRFETYKSRHSSGAYLELKADEVSLLFRHAFEIGAEFQFEDGNLKTAAAVSTGEGCYNLRYSGGFYVKDGVAHVRPTALKLGELDLGALVKERELAFGPERMPKKHLARHLRNLQTLEIEEGRVRLRMWDPNVTW